MTDEMEIDRFIVSDIRIGEHRRTIDPKKVEALAKSIEEIGLKTPITVWTTSSRLYDAVHLVAGLHRLEAYKKLGLKLIRAFHTSGSELDRDLWQIDENLMRSDLTELERADHLKRRKVIFKARDSVKKIDTTPGRPKAFDTDTAEKTGMTRQAVHKSRRRAEKIAPDVQYAIKDMPAADVGVELDALASLEPEQQRQSVRLVTSGASKDFRAAKVVIQGGIVDDLSVDDKARRKVARSIKKIEKFQTRLYMAVVMIKTGADVLDEMDLPRFGNSEAAQEAVDDLKKARRQLGKVIPRIQDINHLGSTS